jgi:hypothetical protein
MVVRVVGSAPKIDETNQLINRDIEDGDGDLNNKQAGAERFKRSEAGEQKLLRCYVSQSERDLTIGRSSCGRRFPATPHRIMAPSPKRCEKGASEREQRSGEQPIASIVTMVLRRDYVSGALEISPSTSQLLHFAFVDYVYCNCYHVKNL